MHALMCKTVPLPRPLILSVEGALVLPLPLLLLLLSLLTVLGRMCVQSLLCGQVFVSEVQLPPDAWKGSRSCSWCVRNGRRAQLLKYGRSFQLLRCSSAGFMYSVCVCSFVCVCMGVYRWMSVYVCVSTFRCMGV